MDATSKSRSSSKHRSRECGGAPTTTGNSANGFGVKLEQPFVEGQFLARPRITNPPGYEHLNPGSDSRDRLEPERLFAFSCTPTRSIPAADYSAEPQTLGSSSACKRTASGTRPQAHRVGFRQDSRSPPRPTCRMNDGGWDAQMKNIERHVAA